MLLDWLPVIHSSESPIPSLTALNILYKEQEVIVENLISSQPIAIGYMIKRHILPPQRELDSEIPAHIRMSKGVKERL